MHSVRLLTGLTSEHADLPARRGSDGAPPRDTEGRRGWQAWSGAQRRGTGGQGGHPGPWGAGCEPREAAAVPPSNPSELRTYPLSCPQAHPRPAPPPGANLPFRGQLLQPHRPCCPARCRPLGSADASGAAEGGRPAGAAGGGHSVCSPGSYPIVGVTQRSHSCLAATLTANATNAADGQA